MDANDLVEGEIYNVEYNAVERDGEGRMTHHVCFYVDDVAKFLGKSREEVLETIRASRRRIKEFELAIENELAQHLKIKECGEYLLEKTKVVNQKL